MINKILSVSLLLFSFNTQAKWFVSSSTDPMTDVKTTVGISSDQSLLTTDACHSFLFHFSGFRQRVGSTAVILIRVDKNPPIPLLTSGWLTPSMINVRGESIINSGLYDQMLSGNKIHFQTENAKRQIKTVADDLIGFTKTTQILGCDKNTILARAQLEEKLAERKREIEQKLAETKREIEQKLAKLEHDIELDEQKKLDETMAMEFSNDLSSARSAEQLSEIAKYEALMRSKIYRYWKVDPSMKGHSCTLAIKLAPDGLVLSARMSGGYQKLCDSARRAAIQAKTLPLPKASDNISQFRDFNITLKAYH